MYLPYTHHLLATTQISDFFDCLLWMFLNRSARDSVESSWKHTSLICLDLCTCVSLHNSFMFLFTQCKCWSGILLQSLHRPFYFFLISQLLPNFTDVQLNCLKHEMGTSQSMAVAQAAVQMDPILLLYMIHGLTTLQILWGDKLCRHILESGRVVERWELVLPPSGKWETLGGINTSYETGS